MKIAFHTLGCKVNQYESEAMKEQFANLGHIVVGEKDFADVYIINTCTVTGLADRKSRQYIRKMKKKNPNSIIAVTGCYVQTNPDQVEKIGEVDIIAGTNEKHKLAEYIFEHKKDSKDRYVKDYEDLIEYEEMGIITGMESRTRAYIKIEEGCDRFCSYCVIPYARGPVRSRNKQEILKEAKQLVESGFKELILTGINTALYDDLEGLLEDLDNMKGDFRVRLSSLEPTVINALYVKKLFKYKRLCHHLHLSLQSGSDNILKAMKRRYDRFEYLEIVKTLREFDPFYGITTDIIVGFPGELKEDFKDSVEMIEKVEYGRVHVFKYSKRPKTLAEKMKDQIEPHIKKDRSEKLILAGYEGSKKFFEKNCGRIEKVLFEEATLDKKYITGYTNNYIKAWTEFDENILNEFADVKIVKPFNDGVYVTIVNG